MNKARRAELLQDLKRFAGGPTLTAATAIAWIRQREDLTEAERVHLEIRVAELVIGPDPLYGSQESRGFR